MLLHNYKLAKLKGTRKHNNFVRALYDFFLYCDVHKTKYGAHLIVFGLNVWKVVLTPKGLVKDIYAYGTKLQAIRNFGPDFDK